VRGHLNVGDVRYDSLTDVAGHAFGSCQSVFRGMSTPIVVKVINSRDSFKVRILLGRSWPLGNDWWKYMFWNESSYASTRQLFWLVSCNRRCTRPSPTIRIHPYSAGSYGFRSTSSRKPSKTCIERRNICKTQFKTPF